MSRLALGRLFLACLLVTCVAIGQAAVESKPAKKHARKGGSKPSVESKQPGDSDRAAEDA